MMAYPLVEVRDFDFVNHCGHFAVDSPSADDTISLANVPYCLVPQSELERAFTSLQDAGEAAGCPVGQPIVDFIRSQKVKLEVAIGGLEDLIAATPADLPTARKHATEIVRHCKEGGEIHVRAD